MIKNYLNILIRNALKTPLYATINVLSLAIGLASFIAIILFIQDEKSFDTFHNKKDNIYRLNEVQTFPGTKLQHVQFWGWLDAERVEKAFRIILKPVVGRSRSVG